MDIINHLQALRAELEVKAEFGNKPTLELIAKIDELVVLLTKYEN